MCVCFLNFFIDAIPASLELPDESWNEASGGFSCSFPARAEKLFTLMPFNVLDSWPLWHLSSLPANIMQELTTALHCTFGTTVRKYSTNLPSTSYDLISKMHDLHLLYLEALPCAQAPLNYAELARAFPITSRTTTKSSHVHPCTAPRTSCNEK